MMSNTGYFLEKSNCFFTFIYQIIKLLHMKKILLTISAFTALISGAQTLNQANHTPSFWDKIYSISQCDSTTVNIGSSGAGSVWNFTPTVHTSLQTTYTTSMSNNGNYNPADGVISASNGNTSYYITTNPNVLPYYGGGLSIPGAAGSVKYTNPAIFAVYPMSLNTSTTVATSGSITLTSPLPTTIPFSGSSSVIADATGTLTLPGRSFDDIIRKTTTQNLIASGTATITFINYEFYSPSTSKSPIVSIQTSTLSSTLGGTSTQTLSYVMNNYDVVSIKETKSNKNLVTVFPNPASAEVNFKANTEANKVSLYDITGKMIATEIFENGMSKINLSNISAGMYFYTILDSNNQTLKSGKLTVDK